MVFHLSNSWVLFGPWFSVCPEISYTRQRVVTQFESIFGVIETTVFPLSKSWVIAQHQYIKEIYQSTKIPTGTLEIWKTSFLPTLLQYGLDLWEQRNKSVHGSTPEE